MQIDRSAVMRDAHARFKRRRGTDEALTFGECLRRAWQAARQRRSEVMAYHSAPRFKRVDRPFPNQVAA